MFGMKKCMSFIILVILSLVNMFIQKNFTNEDNFHKKFQLNNYLIFKFELLINK